MLEGVAFAFADAQDALRRGRAPRSTTLSRDRRRRAQRALGPHPGRGARPPALVTAPAREVGPALGAARLARLAVGGERPEDVCTPPPVAAVIEPDPALRERYARTRCARFRALYARLRERLRAQALADAAGGADLIEPYFPDVEPIRYEGPESDERRSLPVLRRRPHRARQAHGGSLRFAVCYWHSFCWPGSDVFGAGTFERPWLPRRRATRWQLAERKLDVAFEFFEKLGVPFFCFHDRDVAPEGATLRESNAPTRPHRRAHRAATCSDSGVRLLWGTANLFGHPRYAAGAATNPDPEVFAYAAAQVKHGLEATHRLGGANYVLWGGREGYDTLLNTDLRREADQLGRFLQLVVEHKHRIGFEGTLLIEPKPHRADQAPVRPRRRRGARLPAALRPRDGEIKLNIEVNHATLAGHSFQHEVAYAIANDIFGSVDANRGDPQIGWDTDQFPNSVEELTLASTRSCAAAASARGGFNFDAKLRRQSIDPVDLFHAHVGGIDTLARGLLGAAAMIEDGRLDRFVDRALRRLERRARPRDPGRTPEPRRSRRSRARERPRAAAAARAARRCSRTSSPASCESPLRPTARPVARARRTRGAALVR